MVQRVVDVVLRRLFVEDSTSGNSVTKNSTTEEELVQRLNAQLEAEKVAILANNNDDDETKAKKIAAADKKKTAAIKSWQSRRELRGHLDGNNGVLAGVTAFRQLVDKLVKDNGFTMPVLAKGTIGNVLENLAREIATNLEMLVVGHRSGCSSLMGHVVNYVVRRSGCTHG